MVIREAKEEELDNLAGIWLTTSLEAHSFIDPAYWLENKETVRGFYLPLSENFVMEEEEGIKGFLSMMGNYLTALFILPEHQGKGYGKSLLEHIKKERSHIQLKVYEKNIHSYHFYEQNGFQIKEILMDELPGEKEYLMEWVKNDDS